VQPPLSAMAHLQPGDEPGETDPLELEHMIGFAASHDNSVQLHPKLTDTFVCYTGCLILIGSTTDPHQQEFLRGHDEEITCLALSPSGNLIASGQASKTRSPSSEAYVIVWDFGTRQMIYRFSELHDANTYAPSQVMRLCFSPDDHFLAASDDAPNAKLCVWDMPTGSVAAAQRQKSTLSFLIWGPVLASERKVSRHQKYRIFAGSSARIQRYLLEFDVPQMQHTLVAESFKMPSSGLDREYFCAKYVRSATAGFVVAGSSAGELCVFNADTLVFRATLPVSGGGLLSITSSTLPDGTELLYCGCGDGKLKIVSGSDQDWRMQAETRLTGQIKALSASADGASLLVGTSAGDVHLLSAVSLQPIGGEQGKGRPWMSSHTHAVGCAAFGDSSEVVASGASNGVMRLWELSHYGVKAHIAPPGAKGASPTCLAFALGGLVSGWSDGCVRCHSEMGSPLWDMPCTHAGGVYSIAFGPRFMATGGADSTIRLWDNSSRRALAQFAEHRLGHSVTGVLIDRNQPNLLHSCCTDKSIVTIDLKQERRVQQFTVSEGGFTGMIQNVLGEQEIITADATGCVKANTLLSPLTPSLPHLPHKPPPRPSLPPPTPPAHPHTRSR